MLFKILAIATLAMAILTTGCGLAIHFGWAGEDVEATPHIVLGGIVVLLMLVTTIVALVTR